MRTNDNQHIRIWCSTAPTDVRLTTLMHDMQYRAQNCCQQSSYNQPPHASYYLGSDAPLPARPNVVVNGKGTGTGAITYSEFTIDLFRTYHPADSRATASCWIVELDADSNLRLRGYDVNEGALLCEEMLQNPADPANRDYTPAKREAASKPPVFAEDAALTLETDFGACTVTVPAAQSADGLPVVLYRVVVKDSLGLPVCKDWILPSYYRAIPQETVSKTLTDLPAGAYTVSVVAENAYGMQSAPLQATAQVEGESGVRGLFVRISALFNTIKEFFVRLFW